MQSVQIVQTCTRAAPWTPMRDAEALCPASCQQSAATGCWLFVDIFGTKLLDICRINIISSLGYDHFVSYPDVSTPFLLELISICKYAFVSTACPQEGFIVRCTCIRPWESAMLHSLCRWLMCAPQRPVEHEGLGTSWDEIAPCGRKPILFWTDCRWLARFGKIHSNQVPDNSDNGRVALDWT